MKRFCVLSQSGEVLRTGCCQDDMIDAQAGAGETALEVDIDYIELPNQSSLQDVDVKALRNRLLMASDWTQLPDVPLATKAAWATYRQALRDITVQPGYPMAVIWPEVPA